ncbi:LysR family transcriptional regulator ArgP [Agromyces sp. NPDC056523]|uniref:LysR family transcriptional regulator ArgP n=1 Tax=Agromyces sp. NPDC056523 TaxID=3345850 RepID=UPI00366B1305
MKIPLDLARTLAAVVDAGTFEAAAADLSVTPSAVSQRVKQLEQRLGRVLVVRSKPVRVTEAGAAVVRLARQLALLEHDALAAFGGEDATSARPTTVPLAVNADSLGTWFLPALARIAERHPVVFDLHRHDQDFTAELLESGSVMGAVTSQATPVAGCLVRPLGVMRYTAVATPDWIARWCPGGVDVGALGIAPRVDFDRRDDLQAEYLRRLGADGSEPPRHYVPASNDFATAVKLGLGWGLLPGFQSDAELARGELVGIGGPPIDVPLYWQQWNLGSPLLDAIADGITRDARIALAPVA